MKPLYEKFNFSFNEHVVISKSSSLNTSMSCDHLEDIVVIHFWEVIAYFIVPLIKTWFLLIACIMCNSMYYFIWEISKASMVISQVLSCHRTCVYVGGGGGVMGDSNTPLWLHLICSPAC